MSATFVCRGASLCQATHKALSLFALCVVAIGAGLLTFANPAIAIEPKLGGYISPAAVLVTMAPLAPLWQKAPMQLLATGLPSTIMLRGKNEIAMRHKGPSQFTVGKVVVNAVGDEIGVITKVDGAQVVVAVGGTRGAGTYDIGLTRNHFITNGEGGDIRLVNNASTAPLSELPGYRNLD